MPEGRCPACGHDIRVIGHDPRCPEGGIVKQPGVLDAAMCSAACSVQHNARLPDHARPAAELTARPRRRGWFR